MNKLLTWALFVTASISAGCTTNIYNDKAWGESLTQAKLFAAEGNESCFTVTKPDDLTGRYCLSYEGPLPSPTPSGSPTP